MTNATVHHGGWYWESGLEVLDFSDFIQVNRTLIRKLGLHEAILIGELAYEGRMWKRKGKMRDGWFYSTVENIERQTGINPHFQRVAINNLKAAGVIEVGYFGLPRSRHIRISPSRVMEIMADDGENTPSDQQLFTTLTTSDAPDEPTVVDAVNTNKEVSKRSNKKKDSMSGKPDDAQVPYEEVISYLNEKSGKRYRASTEATRKMIRARLSEGYTLDDFKHVIDVKCSQWLGTEHEKYLRPETLFRPSHFESYVNEQAHPKSRLDEIDWSLYEIPE